MAANFNDTFQCAVDVEIETMKLVATSPDEVNASSAHIQSHYERAQNFGMEGLVEEPFQMTQEGVS